MASTIQRPSTLNFITSNPNKLLEVRAILTSSPSFPTSSSSLPTLTLTSNSLDIPELQGTINEIATAKCRQAALIVNGPVLTEDTALEFTALNGLPGPYIKYFLQSLGHEGLNRILAGYEDKSATAICTFAYSPGPPPPPAGVSTDDGGSGSETPPSPPPPVLLFQGRTKGQIVQARGPNTFGWDPIFQYEGLTYAEMDRVRKNEVSHRSKALAKLKAWLAGEIEVEVESGGER